MALLSDRDSLRWHSLGERLSESVEPLLHPGVLANRSLADAVDRGRLRPSLRRARRAVRVMAARSEAVILTDVRSFYPSVSPSVAFRALQNIGVEPDAASEVASMLDGWGSEGYEGLPIGPPASAIMANAVLAPMDAELTSMPFLRWVDDYAVSLNDTRRVPEVLERFDATLDRSGLGRAVPKTRVLGRGDAFGWLGTYGRADPSE
ncbi:MAG: RNA-directed DNA polymerase [Actinomycetota bacterium]